MNYQFIGLEQLMNLIKKYKNLCQKQADTIAEITNMINNNCYEIISSITAMSPILSTSDYITSSWSASNSITSASTIATIDSFSESYESRITALENRIEELLRNQTMNHEPDN